MGLGKKAVGKVPAFEQLGMHILPTEDLPDLPRMLD